MAERTKPLLNLTTITDRHTVTVDGKDYELRLPGELSIAEGVRLRVLAQRIPAGKISDLNEEQARELGVAVDQVCRMVLIAPEDVQERLGDHNRLAVALAFITLSPEVVRQVARAIHQQTDASATTSTGGKSSRNSSGSTGKARGIGSKRNRSRG